MLALANDSLSRGEGLLEEELNGRWNVNDELGLNLCGGSMTCVILLFLIIIHFRLTNKRSC